MKPSKKAAKKTKPAQRNAARSPAARKKPAPKPAKRATKRAPSPKPAPAPEPDRNPWGESQAKLDAFTEEKVRARFIDGKLIAEVAREVGISSGALLAWLDSTPERSARAREARKLGAAVLEEQAHEAITNADDNFKLAKARELAHHLRWKASKLDPRGFGDKLALGAAQDLPPLPPPAAPAQVNVSFEVTPGDTYKQMLVRS